MEMFLESAAEIVIDLTACAVECVIDAFYYRRHGAALEEKFEEQKRKRAEKRAEKAGKKAAE